MKIRTGFVSNSSSSSFVILSKTLLTEAELIEKLDKKIVVPKEHPLHDMSRDMAGTLINRVGEAQDIESIDDPEVKKMYNNMLDGAAYVYKGYLSDECGGTEETLCNMSFNIEDEDFILDHDGGY